MQTGFKLSCPYCNHNQSPPPDCVEEDASYDCRCSHCGRDFNFTVNYMPFYASYLGGECTCEIEN